MIFDLLISRSYLVTDPTQSLILLANPDCLTISVESGKSVISIEQIRDLKEWIILKPFHKSQKIAFIPNANKMTVEAQNSLLKILEEPPFSSFIVLSCKNKRQLLPTVISRCLPLFVPERLLEIPELDRSFNIVNHSDKSEGEGRENNNFENLSLVEGFESAEKIAKLERTKVLEIVDGWVGKARKDTLAKQLPQALELLKELSLLRQRIARNVGIRLAIENFFIQTKT